MEKYGTPQFSWNDKECIKIASERPRPCCAAKFEVAKPGDIVTCHTCGTDLIVEAK